ncbi:MAG: hypothetical protein U0269_12705 [Polyangiales bacterium]
MTDEQEPKAKKASKSKKSAKPADDWTPSAAARTDVRKPEAYDERTNQTDADNEADGLWILVDGQKNTFERRYAHGWVEGLERTFYESGALRRECTWVPAKRAYPDGPKSEHKYVAREDGAGLTFVFGSHLRGTDRMFFENGSQWSERSFDEEGYLHGVERVWETDGTLVSETHWQHGLRNGAHRARNAKGAYDLVEFQQGIPLLPEKTVKSILGKIAKAKGDGHKIGKALQDYVPYDVRHPYAWHLASAGQWDVVKDGWGAVGFLAEDGTAHGPTAIAILRAMASRDDASGQYEMLPGWPYILDRIASRGYRLDEDDAWKQLAASLPASCATGVHFVRGRFGASLADREREAVVEALASGAVAGSPAFVNEQSYRAPDGTIARTPHSRPADVATLYLGIFGGEATFARAVEVAVDRASTLSSYQKDMVFSRLSPKALGRALKKIEGHEPSMVSAFECVSHWSVEQWLEVANEFQPKPEAETDYRRKRAADTIFTFAARAAAREKTTLPERFDWLVSCDAMEWSPGTSDIFKGSQPLRDALATLPPERLHKIAQRLLDLPWGEERAALVISVAPTDELVLAMLSKARAFAAKTPDRSNHKHFAHALGWLGEAGLPFVYEAYNDAQSSDVGKSMFFRVALCCMATAARNGATFDSRYDSFIQVHRPNGERVDKYDVEWLFAPRCAEAVRALTAERAEAVVLRQLDAKQSQWTAPFAMVPHALTDRVIEALSKLLAEKGLQLDTWDRYFQSMLGALGARRVEVLTKVLSSSGDARTHLRSVLSHHLSPDEQQQLDQGAPAPQREGLGALAARVQKLSDSLELAKVSIYLLDRSDAEAASSEVGRSGGPAIGVVFEQWPRLKNGAPMEHVLTLDLELLPDMRARRGLGAYRAVALFVPNRETGTKLEKGAVVMLTQAQIDTGACEHFAPENEPARKIDVERVVVPELIFAPESEWGASPSIEATLRAIKRAVSAAHGRALGLPFYIQSSPDEDGDGEPGRFLLQFDDGLAEINTGDMGLIYVFTGGVFMQCH